MQQNPFRDPNWGHVIAAKSQQMFSANTLLKQTMPAQTDLDQEKYQKFWVLL